MTYKEFVESLARAHLSIAEFASLVRTHRNSLTNCAKLNRVPNHWGIVATLLVEMERGGLDYRKPLQALDIKPKKVRGAAKSGRFGGTKQSYLQFEAAEASVAADASA